jgi:hypothetical protein
MQSSLVMRLLRATSIKLRRPSPFVRCRLWDEHNAIEAKALGFTEHSMERSQAPALPLWEPEGRAARDLGCAAGCGVVVEIGLIPGFQPDPLVVMSFD